MDGFSSLHGLFPAVLSVRGGKIRVSPRFYNKEDNLCAFLETLP